MIVDGYCSLLRARRRSVKRDEKFKRLYRRHRWMVEGRHGEAKTCHGLARAARRGLWNVCIQSYLTAAVMNLKRLSVLAGGLYDNICDYLADILAVVANRIAVKRVFKIMM